MAKADEQPERRATAADEPRTILVQAFDCASAYDLHAAREILKRDFSGRTLVASPLLVQTGPLSMVAVHEYGSVVFLNVPPATIPEVTRRLESCATRLNAVVSRDEFVLQLTP